MENTNSEYSRTKENEQYSEQHLDAFFKLSPDLLCIAGFDGYFKRINPSVCRVLEFSEEELYSRPINDFVFEEDKERTNQARNAIRAGEPLLNFENRYVTKSGSIVWLSWTSIPEKNNRCVYAIAKNITGRKRLEEERALLYKNIASINQELKHFARSTSHDLRAPVNNIISIFNLLDLSTITDPSTLQLIDMLKSTTGQLHRTLEFYLEELMKKDSMEKNTENVYLEQSFAQVILSIESLIQQSEVSIHSDFSAFDIVLFNKTYMESIFLNLLTNAIKYRSPDRKLQIRVYTRCEGDTRQLIVQDNGLGFDLENVKGKIFGLYETFHEHADSKGIGLYLVHTHVTAMGAKIAVDSKVNEGSTFTISFK